MAFLLGLALAAALVLWLVRPSRPTVEPGDAIEPVDREALADAEQDLGEGPGGTTLEQTDEDDWGPGAPG